MKKWYDIVAAADGKSAEISILGEIGMWGMSASEFARDLKAVGEVERLVVTMNSPGGHVYDAFAIYNLLKSHPAEVEINIIGWAASAASMIAMAGDRVTMAENAIMMIHLPRMGAHGTEKQLKSALALLERAHKSMVLAYVTKTGLDTKVIEEMLAEETWFSADEAVAHGFADDIGEAVEVTATFEVQRYASTIPADLMARLTATKESDMDKTKKTPATETAEEMEARIRAEVTAKMEADAAAAADVEAAAGEGDGGAAANADAIRAEMTMIVDACTLAGVPEKASEYLASKKSIAAVMADLKKLAVEGLSNGKPTSARNGSAADDDSMEDGSAIDVEAIYAKWNSPKKSGLGRTQH